MNEQRPAYRHIIKATTLFGGVQGFNILAGIIRSKFMAILLGPAGIGIAGLLSTTTELIGSLTNFGLGTSAVKEISAANQTGNQARISTVVTVVRRWVIVTGTLGVLLTLILSPWLSRLAFGNKQYTIAFAWISVTLLLNQISTGQNVILRGMHRIRYLAQASVYGSTLSLAVIIPIYYIYGLKGIVPAIMVSSVVTLLLTWHFSRRIKTKPLSVSTAATIAEGRGMLKMGFMVSLTGLVSMGAYYIVRVFISNTGGVAEVGLYNAGFTIINTYVGMVFATMSNDYYPRLSAVAHDNKLCKQTINQQAEVSTIILAPIIAAFLVYVNWVVILLYSTKFTAINNMIHWAALGMFFKAGGWSLGFLLLSKGAHKTYLWNEVIGSAYTLALNILGYKIMGLTGLGISFLAAYIIYMAQVYWVARVKYDFSFSGGFYKIFGIQLLLAAACFMAIKLMASPISYILGSLLIAASSLYAYRELDKRIDVRSFLGSFRKRFSTENPNTK